MSWNYRICKCKDGFGVMIHEVYYNNDNSIWGVTKNPIDPYGETPEELIEVLTKMLADAKKSAKDVIDIDKLKFTKTKKRKKKC